MYVQGGNNRKTTSSRVFVCMCVCVCVCVTSDCVY